MSVFSPLATLWRAICEIVASVFANEYEGYGVERAQAPAPVAKARVKKAPARKSAAKKSTRKKATRKKKSSRSR